MRQKRVLELLWLATLILAFLLPTSLELSWDGIPVNHRGEFIFLLLGSLFLLRHFLLIIDRPETGEPTANTKIENYKNLFKRNIGITAAILLFLKMLTPPNNGIELKLRNPNADNNFRYTSEHFISKIDYGGQHTPWRMGFLNTTSYNFISCQPSDPRCSYQKEWKQALSLPFEAVFSIPRTWLRDPSKLNIEFAGLVEILSDNGQSIASYVSPTPKQFNIQSIDKSNRIKIRYRNFIDVNTKPLSFSDAIIRLETAPSFDNLIAKYIGRLLIVSLSLLLLGLVACDLYGSLFPLNRFNPMRITNDWKWVSSTSTMLLIIMFFLSFKSPLFQSQGAFLFVQLLGLILCVSFSLFKRIGSISSKSSIDLIFTLPAMLYLFHLVPVLPRHDGFSLLSDGDDWLTYASVAYEFLERPSWFTDAHYVFTKPLFVYFRAFLYLLLGEGTTYIEYLLRYCLALVPLLLLPAVSSLLSQVNKRGWAITIPIIGYSFFWCIKNFANYILIFWAGMGEIPAWFFGLLACIALVYSAKQILSRESYRSPLIAAAVFSLLASVSRLQSVAALILPWIAVVTLSKNESKRVLKIAMITGALTLAIIIGHAAPIFVNNFKGLVAYLGWTTQMKSSDPIINVFGLFWNRVTFAPQVKILLLLLPIVGGAAFLIRKRDGALPPYWFLIAFALSLFLHAFIRDAAYAPRHYILLTQTTSFLTILFTLLLFAQQASERKNIKER